MGHPKLNGSDVASAETPLSEDATLSGAEAARLLRKIDCRVLPMLFIVYVAAFLDRTNVSNALTMGMPKELHLMGEQPNTALAVFFVPYILFEVPSNILMKKLSPHVWLAVCTLGFGIVMITQGFVKNLGGMIATRFFLGFFEAGIFPGSFYLISFWYKREQAQKRFTVYFCSVIMASAFGGLLATGIANMNGVSGKSNWRWVFIIEGIVTCLVAVAAYFFISDFPSDAKWLTESERRFVLAQTGDRSAANDRITGKDLVQFFREPSNYLGALMYFAVVVPVYAFSYFTPTSKSTHLRTRPAIAQANGAAPPVVKTLGYTLVKTQLHSVPPFASAFGLCIVMAWLSDRVNLRLPFVLFSSALLIMGLSILMTVHVGFSVRYLGICLVCMGALGAAPSIVCWYLMNLQGHKARSIGSAFMISFGNAGGLVAPFAFLPKFAPYYRTGYAICMGVTVLGLVATALYTLLVLRKNRALTSAGAEKHTRFAL
ncbi:putative allantoate permease [Karstenula rhodostoma CBS 690.94]|uniref:Allantoate permease n=1 Tax=Karstenula rhodostoma CBS 690.94 TaxID=1392251 RepID=A0A9P4PNC5_9PLEO|nr:putative allantoate permease [Karstenula rhodostoma CBS 690.94]